jgi:NADH dehydrogenase FAD-containing subunit
MKRLVLIGGGHAHMITLSRLDVFISKGYQVTVIQPSDFHYYSGMGPGMLGGTYEPDDIRFATKQLVKKKGGRFVKAHASYFDPELRVVYLEESQEQIPYDILSCNAGSFVPKDIVEGDGTSVFTSKPIEELYRAKKTILERSNRRAVSIAVLGSGPAAVEIAGNIHQLCKRQALHQPRIQLFCGHSLMRGRSSRVQKLIRRLLMRKGIEIIEEGYVRRVAAGEITLENDRRYSADIIFPAIGVRPSEIFSKSGVDIGSDGGLHVNAFLQSTSHPNIFGGGDCIYFADEPLDKVGVYAVRQNKILFENLLAALEETPLQKFTPGGAYLLIYNLGDGDGVVSKWAITFSGKFAFRLKDYIDMKFINTFQTT